MTALDDRLGAGTEQALEAQFCPDGWTLAVSSEGDELVRVLFEWTKDGNPAAHGEIVWRWIENSIFFARLEVEPDFQGQGFYRWIAQHSGFFRAHGVRDFVALAEDGSFLPAGGSWVEVEPGQWEWNLATS